jgi:hypothetical protein
MKQLYACLAGVALGLVPPLLLADSVKGVEVRAYMNDTCVVADEPYFLSEGAVTGEQRARALPLLGIVVGKVTELLINYGIGHASSRIQNAAVRKDTYYGATREMNLFRADLNPAPALRLNSRLGCLTIVSAKQFQPDGAACSTGYIPREIARETVSLPESEWKTTRSDDSVENKLRRANICVDAQAGAVYEARFEFSEDGTAYRVRDAGYRINSLLTAPSKGATRSVFYTLEIAAPGQKHDQQDVISTAWVNIGAVKAGTQSDAPAGDTQSWLQVPAMSADARRAYDEQTRAYQELAGEIEAARRSISRHRRVVDELERRIAVAGKADMVTALRKEKRKVEVQIQVLHSELQVCTAEYAALPRKSLEFMPVSIRVGVTESRSEKASLLALSTVANQVGSAVASMGGSLSASLVSKSIDPLGASASPSSGSARPAEPAAQLEAARATYYDRLVEYKAAEATGGESPIAEPLADAKLLYNRARRNAGLQALP